MTLPPSWILLDLNRSDACGDRAAEPGEDRAILLARGIPDRGARDLKFLPGSKLDKRPIGIGRNVTLGR